MAIKTLQNEDMSKVVVIHLKRESMEVYGVVRGEKITTAEVEWTAENLVDKLRLVKEKFETKKVRILLADGVAYLWVRPIKEGEKITRQQLESEMESEFPEAVGSMWDYAIEKEGDGEVALVFAPVKEVFDQVMKASGEAKLVIEDVEPERFARRREEDPVVSIAKKSLKGKDEDVLSMKVEVVGEVGDGEVVDEGPVIIRQGRTNRVKKIVLIAGGVILLIGLIVGGIMVSRRATTETEEIVITPVATATPEPTPKPIEWSEISMQILNGSGVTGRAGEIGELMMELGVEKDKIKTGNADNYDYDGVEIMMKSSVSKVVYTQIEEMLQDKYEVVEVDELDEDGEYDMVIVVGSQIESNKKE